MVRLCFVCLGNICRSPTAEGIMLHLVREAGLESSIYIDSAGTGAWHAGELADARSRKVARGRGFELPSRARQFLKGDFAQFDYVLAMDASNLENLNNLASSADERSKLSLMRSWDVSADGGPDVPDPYYGGPQGFDEVFDMCERACRGLLEALIDRHHLTP